MSRQHIQACRRRLDKLKAASGSLNEGPLSAAFADLLDRWGRVPGSDFGRAMGRQGPRGSDIRVDGALVPSVLCIPFGYWEAKDSMDDLDREIAAKLRSGYARITSSTKTPSPSSSARTSARSTARRCRATTKRFCASSPAK